MNSNGFNLTLKQKGILQVLASGMLFGLLGFFGKKAAERNILAEELLGLRFLLGSFFVFLLNLFQTRAVSIKLPTKKILFCALMGIAGYALFSSFYFYAINGISASIAVLLLYTFPVWVLIGGWLFLGETISRQKVLAFPLIGIGLYLLARGEVSVSSWTAFILGASSGFLYAIYILLSRKYLQTDNILVPVIYIQFFAGLSLCLFTFSSTGFSRLIEVWMSFWAQITAIAFLCGAGAMALFQAGLQKIKGWEASLLSTSEPITGILIAWMFLGERLGVWQIVGSVIIIVAFIFLSLPSRSASKAK